MSLPVITCMLLTASHLASDSRDGFVHLCTSHKWNHAVCPHANGLCCCTSRSW